jgi:hypothetical protein
MNPRLPVGFLRGAYDKAPMSFKVEYGGEFSESTESFASISNIEACIDNRPNVEFFNQDLQYRKYFWGFDHATKKDAAALAIGHWDSVNNSLAFVVDYTNRLIIGEGKYSDIKVWKEIPTEDILDWLDHMNELLPCFEGLTDQHGGSLLIHLLRGLDIVGMEELFITDTVNSNIYSNLRLLISQKTIRFPNFGPLLHEIKDLEAELLSRYKLRVQAPQEKGSHDDMADAVALAAWKAKIWSQTEEGQAEIADLIKNPQLAHQARIKQMGKYRPNTEFASLSDIKILHRQAELNRRASTGGGIPKGGWGLMKKKIR